MNIFLVLHPSGNLSVPNSSTWLKNFYEPLVDLGHDITFINLSEFCISQKVTFRSKEYKTRLSSKLINEFIKINEKKKLDLVITYLTSYDIEESTLQKIKGYGIPMANFSCNNTHQFDLVSSISKFFDYNLHSEKGASEKFTKIGANSTWFQMSANPQYYFPTKDIQKYDVSFIGSAYAKRIHYINKLASENIFVDCFGPNWLINKPNAELKHIRNELNRAIELLKILVSINAKKRLNLSANFLYKEELYFLRNQLRRYLHYPIEESQMNTLINQTKINLGFLEVFTDDSTLKTTQQHLHLREFEIPLAGGLYITNYSDELAEFYEPDIEVLVFRNELELKDKIIYCLKNEKHMAKIRQNGYKRALADHTCQIRFQKLFRELKLN